MWIDDERLRRHLLPIRDVWCPRPGTRDAAVVAPLVRGEEGDRLLLTARSPTLPHHAGEISFPGGAREGDERPLACMLRELGEELGIGERAVEVLGMLPARTSIAGFHVHPFVARIDPSCPPRIDPDEVAELLHADLDELADPRRWAGAGRGRYFPIRGHRLWGLTARFVVDLLDACGRARR